MVKKCHIWASRIENKSLTFFTLKQFLESSEESFPDQIKINVAEHLRCLRNTFTCKEIHKIQGVTEEEQD
jgi:hypothetical protein